MGSARLELVSGVALLREEDAVLGAMLAGWAEQQLGGRGPSARTVRQRQAVVRQFLDHAGEYPWNWTAANLDDWSADLAGVAGKAKSTIGDYHDAIRSFESYLIAPQYRWAGECQARFGTDPVRICFESNHRAGAKAKKKTARQGGQPEAGVGAFRPRRARIAPGSSS